MRDTFKAKGNPLTANQPEERAEYDVLITCRAATAKAIAAHCITRSQRIEVTPLPDDLYGIDVRDDAADAVIRLINDLES